jgi:hypothetical protein
MDTVVLPRLPLLCVFLSPLSICMLAPVGLAYFQHYGRKWKLRRDLWLVGLALCWIGCIVSGCIWIWQCKPEALMVSLQLPLVNAILIEVCMLAACGTERANACRSILACTYVQRSTTKNAYGTIKIGTPSQSAQLQLLFSHRVTMQRGFDRLP